MAFETGTASDHTDLLNKLHAFLTSDADLVAANQQWAEVWTKDGASAPFSGDTAEFVLQGPGLDGADEILVGFKLYEEPTDDVYGVSICGFAGLLGTADNYLEHIQPSGTPFLPLSGAPMTYWFVASGRRVVAVVKNSTSFDSMHAGLFYPYASPDGYPYPMAIGASAPDPMRWSSTESAHAGSFLDPRGYVGQNPANGGYTLWVYAPGGGWFPFGYSGSDGGSVYSGTLFPYKVSSGTRIYMEYLEPSPGGERLLTPVSLIAEADLVSGTLGMFEGVYHVGGFSNAAENLVTVDGVDHLVVQNGVKSGFYDYWALRLA